MIIKEKANATFDDIADDLAIKTGASKAELHRVYRSMTDTIEKSMKEESELIKIDNVGKFILSKGKLKASTENKLKNKV